MTSRSILIVIGFDGYSELDAIADYQKMLREKDEQMLVIAKTNSEQMFTDLHQAPSIYNSWSKSPRF